MSYCCHGALRPNLWLSNWIRAGAGAVTGALAEQSDAAPSHDETRRSNRAATKLRPTVLVDSVPELMAERNRHRSDERDRVVEPADAVRVRL